MGSKLASNASVYTLADFGIILLNIPDIHMILLKKLPIRIIEIR